MVKNKSYSAANILKFIGITLKTAEFAAVLAIMGFSVFLWRNPQTVASWLNIAPVKPQPENTYVIDNINRKIESLNLNIRNDSEKIDLINRQFSYFDKSKADNSQIITLNDKIDALQSQASKLAKASNSGALILTSAMLIRDNVSRGITCQREAEALKILAANTESMNRDVEFVANHCNLNFMSANSITNSYGKIYKEIKTSLEPKPETIDWKQRLLSKIGEYIKISQPNQADTKEFNQLAVLAEIKKLVDNGDLAAAASEFDKPENSILIQQHKQLEKWYLQTKNQLEFYKSLSNIISESLLIMKVEDAQHDRQ